MRKILFLILIGYFGTVSGQKSFLRYDVNFGPGRFVGRDLKEMKNNQSWAVGVLKERESSGQVKSYGRWGFGVRFRHIQGEVDHFSNDSLGQLVRGFEKYRYNYLEFPFTSEVDILSGAAHVLSIGPSFGAFAAIPFGVKGERSYPGAIPWSKKYETPYFLLGFQVGGYFGINLEKMSFKAHYTGQFPFIPVHNSPPSSSTGPDYKLQLLGMRGWMFSAHFVL